MNTRMLMLGLTIAAASSAYAGTEAYGPHNLDGGQITCKSPSGDEIKKSAAYAAPSDRFFIENSISVTELSGWAPKKHGCNLTDVTKKEITVQTEAGPVPVNVITGFTAYAYADCGTDIAKFVGKTAAVECTVKADMVEFRK